MSNDLNFVLVSNGETIYDTIKITDTNISIRVINFGEDNISDLGFYISPATSVGDVDFPADYPPETDYEDLLTWGTKSFLGLISEGGLWISIPTNDGIWEGYITRSNGSQYNNKIPFKDLVAGEEADFDIRFETPLDTEARRFFIDLKLE